MFRNYQELFHGYVEFYKSSLYGSAEAAAVATGSTTQAPISANVRVKRQALMDEYEDETSGFLFSSDTNERAEAVEPMLRLANNQSQTGTGGDFLKTNNLAPSSEHTLQSYTRGLTLDEPGGKVVRIGEFNSLELIDVVHMTTVFIVLLLAKRFLSRKLSSYKRIDQLGLRQKDRERLDESIWRLIYYSFSSTWLIYSCLKHNSHLLLFSGSSNQQQHRYTFELDWSSYAIFMIEAAFYVHATYALLFEDVWRRDSPMMLVHHLAAVFATLSLYATRTHQIGLASTVLRDTCDVLLEVTKLTKCLHIQHGKRVRSLGLAVNCFLIVFALAFALNQLYYFPLFCLYHGLNIIKLYQLQTPVMIGILTCGLIFLLLDILWFGLILRLLYYMMFSGKPMKDLREYDDEDEDIVTSNDDDHDDDKERDGRKLKRE